MLHSINTNISGITRRRQRSRIIGRYGIIARCCVTDIRMNALLFVFGVVDVLIPSS